jgi:hypothetical protein
MDSYVQTFLFLSRFLDWNKINHVGVDFEYNLVKCLKKFAKDGAVSGCYFHYKQALYRKYKSLYSSPTKIQDATFKIYCILPFLPEQQYLEIVDFLSLDLFNMKPFTKYYNRVWASNYDVLEKFKISINIRTNDCLESLHSRIHHKLENAHPQLIRITQILFSIDNDYNTKLNTLRKEHKSQKRKEPVKYGIRSVAKSFKSLLSYATERKVNYDHSFDALCSKEDQEDTMIYFDSFDNEKPEEESNLIALINDDFADDEDSKRIINEAVSELIYKVKGAKKAKSRKPKKNKARNQSFDEERRQTPVQEDENLSSDEEYKRIDCDDESFDTETQAQAEA